MVILDPRLQPLGYVLLPDNSENNGERHVERKDSVERGCPASVVNVNDTAGSDKAEKLTRKVSLWTRKKRLEVHLDYLFTSRRLP